MGDCTPLYPKFRFVRSQNTLQLKIIVKIEILPLTNSKNYHFYKKKIEKGNKIKLNPSLSI